MVAAIGRIVEEAAASVLRTKMEAGFCIKARIQALQNVESPSDYVNNKATDILRLLLSGAFRSCPSGT